MVLLYIIIGILLSYSIFVSLKFKDVLSKTSQDKIKLTQSIQKGNTILQNINVYFLLIDRDFVVKETNFYRLNGAQDDGVKRRVGDLLHCKSALEAEGGCGTHERCKLCGVRAVITRSFIKGEDFRRYEASMKLLNNDRTQVIPCDVSVSGNYINPNGEEMLVLTVSDISELKNAQRLLSIEKENAFSYDQLKASFIANMSHEVRTPLNAIIGFSGLLAIAADEAEKNMYMEIINTNNDRLLQLINDILDLSQIEAGALDFSYSDFDVNDVLREVYELFKMRVSEKTGISFVCNVGMEPIMIHSERQRIMQVLTSLLINALKFTQKGEISMGCQLQMGGEVYFYVADTGMGIPESERSKIFDRFMKLDREVPGTGLGLTLARTIVEKLGGRISVESQQNVGSTFSFILPVS